MVDYLNSATTQAFKVVTSNSVTINSATGIVTSACADKLGSASNEVAIINFSDTFSNLNGFMHGWYWTVQSLECNSLEISSSGVIYFTMQLPGSYIIFGSLSA